jgi:FkbM family methyltransferase
MSDLHLSDEVLQRRVFRADVNQHLRRSTILRALGPFMDPNKVAVDVGGATGHITCFLAEHMDRVVAFEAVPPVFDQLKKMESVYDNVMAINMAVSDFVGHSKFFVDDKRLSNSCFNDLVGGQEIEVTVTKLDAIFPAPSNIGFIKIDVEGTELDVLKGAEDILVRDKPNLMVEIYEPYTVPPIIGLFEYLMEDNGYACYFFDPDKGLCEVENPAAGVWAVNNLHNKHDGDFLFTPAD